MAADKNKKLILWFSEVGIKDIPIVGGKNASLGEMYQKLHDKGINVPNGFAITAYAYRYLLEHAGIEDEIKEVLSDLDTEDMHNLAERGEKCRNIIRHAKFPDELRDAIIEAYKKMEAEYGENVDRAALEKDIQELHTRGLGVNFHPYYNCAGFGTSREARRIREDIETVIQVANDAAQHEGRTIAINFHAASGFPPQQIEMFKKMAAEGKTITPQDIANAVAFLVSDVSQKVSGQCIKVSGST